MNTDDLVDPPPFQGSRPWVPGHETLLQEGAEVGALMAQNDEMLSRRRQSYPNPLIFVTGRFPSMALPPNHPFLDGIFHDINHPFGGYPAGTPHIVYQYSVRMIYRIIVYHQSSG